MVVCKMSKNLITYAYFIYHFRVTKLVASSSHSTIRSNDGAATRMLESETVASLQYVGNNGYPEDAFPLGFCEGDCDSDEECEGSLVCFEQDFLKEIPGCGAIAMSPTDFCVNPDYSLLPFDDEISVKKEVTLGIYVGTEKYVYEGVVYPFCSKTVFMNEDMNKLMFWFSNPGSCEEAGVNQVTGKISGDWFGNIDLNEIYIEQVKSTTCIPAADCDPNLLMENLDESDDLKFSETYEVKTVSCGVQHKYDLPREKYYCDAWQVALLQKKESIPIDDELPDEMVVMTVTYGDAFTDIENPGCPKKPVYSLSDIDKEEFAVGSAQFVLQGDISNRTDVCVWDCLDKETKELYGCVVDE